MSPALFHCVLSRVKNQITQITLKLSPVSPVSQRGLGETFFCIFLKSLYTNWVLDGGSYAHVSWLWSLAKTKETDTRNRCIQYPSKDVSNDSLTHSRLLRITNWITTSRGAHYVSEGFLIRSFFFCTIVYWEHRMYKYYRTIQFEHQPFFLLLRIPFRSFPSRFFWVAKFVRMNEWIIISDCLVLVIFTEPSSINQSINEGVINNTTTSRRSKIESNRIESTYYSTVIIYSPSIKQQSKQTKQGNKANNNTYYTLN